MTQDDKITVDLSTIMKDGQGEDIIIVPKTSVVVNGTMMTINNKALQENKKYIFGNALCDLLSKSKAQNIEDAAKITRWHAKIFNEITKAKPKILLDKEELKDLKIIISTTPSESLNNLIDGIIFDVITDYIELAINKK